MKLTLVAIILAFLVLVGFSRYETEILTFLHHQSPAALTLGGLITLMLLAELGKKKPKKKED